MVIIRTTSPPASTGRLPVSRAEDHWRVEGKGWRQASADAWQPEALENGPPMSVPCASRPGRPGKHCLPASRGLTR